MSHDIFNPRFDRRTFLQTAGLGLAGACTNNPLAFAADQAKPRLKVAAVVTEFTYRSHAHVILENFLEPYFFNGKRTESGMDVVALYMDQLPAKEIGGEIAKAYKIPIYPTIAKAICAGGTTLAVDAVLSIAEQGKYRVNDKAQTEYPRKRFFDEIVSVFKQSGRVVPLFNDKHLSYRWDWAREMADTAKAMNIPFMAGSSVPLAQRRPALELSPGRAITTACSIHGGSLEGYDFHALEVLQSIVEARAGGEKGIASVLFLQGDALWDAAKEGLWQRPCADAAMAAEIGPGQPTLAELVKTSPYDKQKPHGILLTYRDGLRAIALRIGRSSTRWNFASLSEGDDTFQGTSFYTGPWENRNLFKALSHAIQTFFREQKSPYPVERTLLTTGALDAAMDSRKAGGKVIDTPHLNIAYSPTDYRAMREMGDTWKIITPDTSQPKGIDLNGKTRKA